MGEGTGEELTVLIFQRKVSKCAHFPNKILVYQRMYGHKVIFIAVTIFSFCFQGQEECENHFISELFILTQCESLFLSVCRHDFKFLNLMEGFL